MVINLKRAVTVGAVAVFLTASLGLGRSGRTLDRALAVGPGTPLHGHAGPVSSVAFSPNGRTLATATENGTVQLWDLRRDRLVGTLRGLVHIVDSVAFSPNGRTVAAGSRGGAVRLWDAPSRRQLGAALKAHSGSVYSVVFSPNGHITRGCERQWDGPVVGRATATDCLDSSTITPARSRASRSVPMDAASRPLTSEEPSCCGTCNTAARLGVPLQTHHLVNSVAYCPDGRTLAVGNGDSGTVGLWDVQGQHLVRTLRTGNSGPVNSVAFAPHKRILATGSGTGTVQLWGCQPATSSRR